MKITYFFCYVSNRKTVLYISSLISNLVNTSFFLVAVKLFSVLTTLVPLFTLNCYNNNYNNNCLSDTTVRYSNHKHNRISHATYHKTVWITTDWLIALSYYFLFNTFSLTNVLEMKRSCSRFLEKSIATILIFLNSHTYLHPHAYCRWFRCSMYLLMHQLMLSLCYPFLSYLYWYCCHFTHK